MWSKYCGVTKNFREKHTYNDIGRESFPAYGLFKHAIEAFPSDDLKDTLVSLGFHVAV